MNIKHYILALIVVPAGLLGMDGDPGRFFEAIEQGDHEFVSQYIAKGHPTNIHDPEGRTALHVAASQGHVELLQILIDAGAPTHTQDNHGNTFLHAAALAGQNSHVFGLLHRQYPELFYHLIDRPNNAGNRSLTIVDANGRTVLHHSCIDGNTELVRALARRNNDLVNQLDRRGCSPFWYALIEGDQKMTATLIEVSTFDRNRRLPEFMDALDNAPEDVLPLLPWFFSTYGVDPNTVVDESSGRTALFYACNQGNLTVFEYLIQNGANISHRTHDGNTNAHMAARNNDHSFLKVIFSSSPELFSTSNLNHEGLPPSSLGNLETQGIISIFETIIALREYPPVQNFINNLISSNGRTLDSQTVQALNMKTRHQLLLIAISLGSLEFVRNIMRYIELPFSPTAPISLRNQLTDDQVPILGIYRGIHEFAHAGIITYERALFIQTVLDGIFRSVFLGYSHITQYLMQSIVQLHQEINLPLEVNTKIVISFPWIIMSLINLWNIMTPKK